MAAAGCSRQMIYVVIKKFPAIKKSDGLFHFAA